MKIQLRMHKSVIFLDSQQDYFELITDLTLALCSIELLIALKLTASGFNWGKKAIHARYTHIMRVFFVSFATML